MSQDPAAAVQQTSTAAPIERQALRTLFAIDENARVLAFAQTLTGRLVLVALFAAVLAIVKDAAWPQVLMITGAAAACAYLPKYRAPILFGATVALLIGKPTFWFVTQNISDVMRQEQITRLSERTATFAALLVFFLCAWGTLEFARRRNASFLARKPVVALLCAVTLMLALACSPLLHGISRVALWSLLIVFTSYLWFLAYALVDQRSRDRSPHLFQLGVFHPFWGSTSTPFGKGAAFLRKMQAKNPQELAVTQLKALKLLVWSWLLLQLETLLVGLMEGRLHLPRIALVQAAFFEHHPYPLFIGWASLVWATGAAALSLAIWGHQIVALARLAGFRLPRNTWRPLESRTLVDFWNRYYYYFKELLVQFFFLPTFLRMFRNHPRLRVFFATFMAAGVGNAVYHFIRDIGLAASMGLWGAIESYTSYLFYCTVLATGIAISQARANAGFKPSPKLIGRVWSFFCVWAFVVCLHVFGDESRAHGLGERLSFMASLFGVNEWTTTPR